MFFVILWYQRWTWDNLLPSLCVCVCVCVCTFSHVQLFATTWIVACQVLCPWDFPGTNTEVGCFGILQGIFPTQGLNLNPQLLCLLHCRRILCCWAIGEALDRSITKFTPKFIRLRQMFVHMLSCDPLFATPWTAVCQASLSFTILEFAQTHVCWVGDAIQPSHPMLPSSSPALNFSQHKGLFQWVGSLHQVVKVPELQLQHQSFQWIFRIDFL